MKSNLIGTAVSCLIGAGAITATLGADILHDHWTTKGYVTIGDNVVVLPERIRSGDRIEFIDAKGEKVHEQQVGRGYLEMNFSRIPSGVYSMTLYRDGDMITDQTVPIAGERGGQKNDYAVPDDNMS